MLLVASLFQIAVGLLAPLLLARFIHGRWGVAYRLLLPGLIAGIGLLLLTPAVEWLAARAAIALPASIAEPGLAVLIGAGTGLLTAIALALTFRTPAREVVTLPQAGMVGVGVGGAGVLIRAGLAALVLLANLSLIDRPPDEWGLPPEEIVTRQADLDAYFARPAAEPLLDAGIALARIALGLALTRLSVLMFLRGEVGWFFGTLFWAGLAATGPVLFGRGGAVALAVWWALTGLGSLILLARAGRSSR